jgi:hypothetical protein
MANENLHPGRIPGSCLQLGILVGWYWVDFSHHIDGERIVYTTSPLGMSGLHGHSLLIHIETG